MAKAQEVKVRFIHPKKEIKDMHCVIPTSWKGDKIAFLYRTYHVQCEESVFPDKVNLILFGKALEPDQPLETLLSTVIRALL